MDPKRRPPAAAGLSTEFWVGAGAAGAGSAGEGAAAAVGMFEVAICTFDLSSENERTDGVKASVAAQAGGDRPDEPSLRMNTS